MLSVEEALRRILDNVQPVSGTEDVPLTQAVGRVLAVPLAAKFDQPPFAASAMDGYAVRMADLEDGTPAVFEVIGEAAAGHGFAAEVGAHQAVRIFTGAPLPIGTDAIVIQENAARDGVRMQVISGTVDPGHVRPRAGDFAAGEDLIPDDRWLTARDVTLAAAMGHGRLRVRRRPIVAILATGDELVMPGTTPGAAQIVCSNSYGISAIVSAAGGQPKLLGIAKDTRASLEERLKEAAGADILITIGGASVGDHDLVTQVLQDRGMQLDFWKLAMRPGKPVMFGKIDGMRMIGVPGNPVSSLICTRIFAAPLIARLSGIEGGGLVRRELPVACDMPANGPRAHYMRALRVTAEDGRTVVRPCASQDSSLLSVLAAADVMILRPPHAPAIAIGTNVTVLGLDF